MPEPTTAMRFTLSPSNRRLHRNIWSFCGREHPPERPHVSHNAEPAEGLEDQVGDIEFPPALSLAAAAGREMVIVVPAFAECDQSEPKVVAAFIRSIEAARAPQVAQRVDGERAVVEHHCRNHIAPEKGRPSTDQSYDCAKRHCRNPVVPVQPTDFRETEEFSHGPRIIIVEVVGDHPTQDRPPETAKCGRVHIPLPIRLPMMQSMM